MKAIAYVPCVVVAAGYLATNVLAVNWTQYRGSHHDGVSTEVIRLNWPEQPPKTLWKVSLPYGLSSFSVDRGKIFTMATRSVQGQKTEFCVALNADTGAELWAAPIGLGFYPNGGVGADDGCRGTPTVDGERVYAFGAYMNLVCLNTATGAEIWRRDLQNEFSAYVIPWQNAASPLLVNDLIIVNGNGRPGEHLLAFKKSDGSVAWQTGSDGMTQSSPVAATIGGIEQAIFFAQSGLVSVEAKTGAVLWKYPITYNGTSVAASPVVAGDTVYASRAYPRNAGAVVVRIAQTGGAFSASKIWDMPNQLMNHWATPVYYEGHYYGMYGQNTLTFRAVDASTGATKWSVPGFGYGSVTRVNDKLLALSEHGTLALVEANPSAYTELARIEPLQGRCWNNPAVSDGRIYIRSTTEAVALDVSMPRARVPVKLEIAGLSGPANDLTISIGAADGAALDASQVSTVKVFASDSLGADANWELVTNPTTLVDGKLHLAPLPVSDRARYFRTEQKE